MGNLYKRKNSRYWWFSTTINGKLLRFSTKKTNKNDGRTQMKIMERDLLKKGGEKKEFHKYTLKDCFELYLEDCESRGVKESSISRFRGKMKVLKSYFDKEMKIVDLNRRMIKKYIDKRKYVDNRKNSTINTELRVLRSSVFFMVYEGNLPESMKYEVRWRHLEENIREDFIEKWELDNLVNNCEKEYLKYIIMFGFYTGCRKSEILSIIWDDVIITDGIVK